MNQVWRIAVKVAASVAVILAAASVTFFAQLAVPGDRATALMNLQTGQEKLWTAEELAPLNERFGFDDPILVQYLHYLTGLFQGDLGTSYTQKRPVADVIGGQLPPSLILTVAALAVAWLLALGMTLLTVKRGRFLSGLGSAWEALTASLPHYWVGVVLLVVFAVQLRMFPIIGGAPARGARSCRC
nr:hypothetical protein GCM10020092_037470 [Actinoplanes digitatis]